MSGSNVPSQTDNPQSNNNKQEGPSDSNYACIKAQDKTRTEHIRTRAQKSIKKGKDTRAHRSPRLLLELKRRLDSTPDRTSPALLLLNRNLYAWRTTSRVWDLEFHRQGGFQVEVFFPLKILTFPLFEETLGAFFFLCSVSWGLGGFDDIWGENQFFKNFFWNDLTWNDMVMTVDILAVDAYFGMELCTSI
jgi:hypothetical protein